MYKYSKYPKEDLESIIQKSKSLADVVRFLHDKKNTGAYPWLRQIIRENNIDTSHFDFPINPESKETRPASGLKIRNLALSYSIEYKCNRCQLTKWQGEEIRLDVDHIDGNSLNNNKENLQFLCPNCHRLKTYPVKSREPTKLRGKCETCNKEVSIESRECRKCSAKRSKKKIENFQANHEDIFRKIWETPLYKAANFFKVSRVWLSNFCKKHKIPTPTTEYWVAFNNTNRESEAKEIRDAAEKIFKARNRK